MSPFNRLPRVTVIALTGLILTACAPDSQVDPTVAAVGASLLDSAVPADLDRFSIDGDLFQVAHCHGHIATSARATYGDSLDVAGGDVEDHVTRDRPVRFEAQRGDPDAHGRTHWTITRSDATPRSVDPADFKAQVQACVAALQAKMDGAKNRRVTQERNQAAWAASAAKG